MRVRGKVVGNTVVLEQALPEGAVVEVSTSDEGVQVDPQTEAELVRSIEEADRDGDISVEEVFASLPPRKRSA